MIKIDFGKLGGIIPVITQDYKTNEVLMLGFMNKEAYEKTLETKKVTYWSRSRKRLWTKGETSGNFQLVKEIMIDCDDDTLLIKVEQKGAACHKGYKSCFFRRINNNKVEIISKRLFNPEEVYKNERK